MTKDHIIIGFGRWGKIIFENIQNKNFLKEFILSQEINNLYMIPSIKL